MHRLCENKTAEGTICLRVLVNHLETVGTDGATEAANANKVVEDEITEAPS